MDYLRIPKKNTYIFGTWNVNGLERKKKDVFSEIERENVDLVVLTEIHLRGNETKGQEYGNYKFYYSGMKTTESDTDTKAGPSADTKTGPAADTKAVPAADAKVEPSTDTKTELSTNTKVGPAANTNNGPPADTKAESPADTTTGPAADTETAADAKVEPSTDTKTEPSANTKVGPAADANAKKKTNAGVAIFIKKDIGKIVSCKAVSKRIITAKLIIHETNVTIIGVYGRNETDKPQKKKKFKNYLKKELEDAAEDELIILGDFNSKVGTSTNSNIVGKFGDNEINSNGRKLIKICETFNLKIQNTFFDHEDIHKYTCYNKQKISKSIIDYCITRQKTKLIVRDVLACRWLECGTDHIFLAATISFSNKNNENRGSVVDENVLEIIKYKTCLLYSKTFSDSYKKYLDSFINLSTENSTNRKYKYLKKMITFCDLKIQDKDMFGEFLWDKEIKDLRERRGLPSTATYDSKIKNEIWEGVLLAIDNTERNKRSKRACIILDEMLNKSNENVILDDPSKDFCKNLFQSNQIGAEEVEEEEVEEVYVHKIDPGKRVQVNVADVTKALDELDDDKWPVPGNLSIQLFRHSSDKTKSLLTNLIEDIFNGKGMPTEIGESYITNLVKRKDSEEYAIEDGLHVHCIMRVMCFILNKMLENSISLEINQLTHLDATFTLRLLLQNNIEEQNPPLHFAFVDLKQLYFDVQHSKLFKVLEKHEVSETLLAALQNLFSSNYIRVVTTNKLSEKFILTKGLIEKSNLGSTLLKMYIQESIKDWNDENSGNGITIDNRILSYIISNDKVIIVAPDHITLETMVSSLKDHLKKVELHITYRDLKYLGNKTLSFDGNSIEGENFINFNGSILELDGGNSKETCNRIRQTKNAICYLHPVVRDESVSLKHKSGIFNKIIGGILMNGCETWTLDKDLHHYFNLLEEYYWRWCSPSDVLFANAMQSKTIWYGKVQHRNTAEWPRLLLSESNKLKKNGKKGKWAEDRASIREGRKEYKQKLQTYELFFERNLKEQ